MPVRDLPQTVEVAPEALLQNAHRQNPPQVHPRAARVPAAARKHVRVQKAEQLRPRPLVQIDRLNPEQKRRDVVPRLRVQIDRPDVGRAQIGLLRNDFPHVEILRKFWNSRRIRGESGESGRIRKRKIQFIHGNSKGWSFSARH